MQRSSVVAILPALATLVFTACGGEKPAPAADTQAVAQESPEVPAESAPAPTSRIGALPVFDRLSPDHRCARQSFEGLTTIVREITYDGDIPPRTIRVSLAAPDRGFQIVNVEIVSRRETSPGQEERERVFVVFTPTGEAQSGTREYTSASNPDLNTRVGLQPGDDASVKQLAQDVVDQCGNSAT